MNKFYTVDNRIIGERFYCLIHTHLWPCQWGVTTNTGDVRWSKLVHLFALQVEPVCPHCCTLRVESTNKIGCSKRSIDHWRTYQWNRWRRDSVGTSLHGQMPNTASQSAILVLMSLLLQHSSTTKRTRSYDIYFHKTELNLPHVFYKKQGHLLLTRFLGVLHATYCISVYFGEFPSISSIILPSIGFFQ